jgi:hypothetical protein
MAFGLVGAGGLIVYGTRRSTKRSTHV